MASACVGCVAFLPTSDIGVFVFFGRRVAFLPAASAAMADASFLEMARGFGEMLPPEERPFWQQILTYYEQGIFPKELVLENLRALQKRLGRGAPTPEPPRPPGASSSGSQEQGVPKAWQQPPHAIYHPSMGQAPAQPGWHYPGLHPQQFVSQPTPVAAAGVFSDHAAAQQMFYAQPWQYGQGWVKGQGKGQQEMQHQVWGHGGKKGGGKWHCRDDRQQGGGKQGGLFFRKREVVALDLADAERRLQSWMDDHPDFVFRPRESVPAEFEDLYNILGENGPQLWKNLRHHLTGEEGEQIAGQVLQYMAERSTWRADKMNQVELQRRHKRDADADTSRMSVATGYTNCSALTSNVRQ